MSNSVEEPRRRLLPNTTPHSAGITIQVLEIADFRLRWARAMSGSSPYLGRLRLLRELKGHRLNTTEPNGWFLNPYWSWRMRSQNKIVNVSPFHSVQTISSYKADGGNIFDPRINPDAVHAFGSRTLPPGVTTAADNAHHDQH